MHTVYTLPGINVSHLGKETSSSKGLGRGYVSFQEGMFIYIYRIELHFVLKTSWLGDYRMFPERSAFFWILFQGIIFTHILHVFPKK